MQRPPPADMLARYKVLGLTNTKVYCCFHHHFHELQENPARTLEVSVKYRATMDSACQDLEGCKNYVGVEQELLYMRMFSSQWHLFEIFYLLPKGELVAPHLFEWQHKHLGVVDKYTKENMLELERLDRPEDSPDYWNMLYKLALIGLYKYVRELLYIHSSWK